MIDARTLTDPLEPIYTWVENGTGRNINISVRPLWTWVQEAIRGTLPITMVPLDQDRKRDYIRNNVVDRLRVKQLWRREDVGENLGPMIFGDRGTMTDGAIDVMHIDGHHRYVLWAIKGLKYGPAVLLRPDQWRPFQIEGLPDIDQSALRAIPPTRRAY